MKAPHKTIKRAKELRTQMTKPEVILWKALRRRQLQGLRFRRQHPIGPYILDFYCDEIRLCIEVDGAAHEFEARARLDARKDAWLKRHDINVLRIPARILGNNLEAVLQAIAASPLSPPSRKRFGGQLPQRGSMKAV